MIDILVPFYGDPTLLRLAVESVRAQTVSDWRLLIVDDCCPDADADWIAALGDERICYYRNNENLGVNGNFQRCLELATADHVVFMGCDDVMLPRYVEAVGAAAAGSPAAMVQPAVQVIDHEGLPLRTLTDSVKWLLGPRIQGELMLGGEPLATSLLRGNWIYFPAMCWRREAIERVGFQPDLHLVLDLALILDLLVTDKQLLLLEEVCFCYRRHNASASVRAALDTHRFDEERAFFQSAAEQMSVRGWPKASRAARRHVTSRLHAATRLPAAAMQRDRAAAGALLRHALA